MEAIKAKIKELFAQSDILTDYDRKDWIERHDQAIKDMTALMDELKALATAKGTLVGRVMRLPHADGSALYVVMKVNKTTAQVVWLPWIDNWQDNVLGDGATIPIPVVSQNIGRQDALARLFSNPAE